MSSSSPLHSWRELIINPSTRVERMGSGTPRSAAAWRTRSGAGTRAGRPLRLPQGRSNGSILGDIAPPYAASVGGRGGSPVTDRACHVAIRYPLRERIYFVTG